MDTPEELIRMLQGFQYVTKAPVHTVIMWVEVGQVGVVRRVLESSAAGYSNVQPYYYSPT